ncbi:MAG: hypothetical protein RLZZ406_1307, partial [Pseudomonadota bacterium]
RGDNSLSVYAKPSSQIDSSEVRLQHALVPSTAAREVVVSSLATVYTLSSPRDAAEVLIPSISSASDLLGYESILKFSNATHFNDHNITVY